MINLVVIAFYVFATFSSRIIAPLRLPGFTPIRSVSIKPGMGMDFTFWILLSEDSGHGYFAQTVNASLSDRNVTSPFGRNSLTSTWSCIVFIVDLLLITSHAIIRTLGCLLPVFLSLKSLLNRTLFFDPEQALHSLSALECVQLLLFKFGQDFCFWRQEDWRLIFLLRLDSHSSLFLWK